MPQIFSVVQYKSLMVGHPNAARLFFVLFLFVETACCAAKTCSQAA